MLYGNKSISAYSLTNVSIWMALAFQAGLLNIGGFLACHQFVSHVTGFAAFFGMEISHGEYDRAFGMLLVPVLFLTGSMLSGLLVDIRLKRRKEPKYHVVFGVMFSLTILVVLGGVSGFFGSFGQPIEQTRGFILISLLCLICGIQNGTITVVSKAVVRTTHLTGITTDLGIGVIRVLNRNKLPESTDEDLRANYMRLGIILFFGFGSLMGALIFPKYHFGGFLFPAVVSGSLFVGTLYFHLTRSKQTSV